MKQDNALQVYYDEKLVGTLAMTANQKAGVCAHKGLFWRPLWRVCGQSSG